MLTRRRHPRAALLLLLALSLLLPPLALAPPARAAGACVVANTNPIGDGSLYACVFDTTVDNISFAPGVTGTIAPVGPLTINRSLTITGPGSGVLAISGVDGRRVVNIGAGNVTISGLTLTHGRAINAYGANLRWTSPGTLTLTDVALTAGSADADFGGAGAYIGRGTVAMTDVRIVGNTAPGTAAYGTGAGLYIDEFSGDTAVMITNGLIAGNTATSNSGGGLAVVRTSGVAGRSLRVTLTNTTVGTPASPNRAADAGGGIYASDATLTLIDSTISGNKAGGAGGGMFVYAGTTTVTGSTLSANESGNPNNGGGGINAYYGTTTLTNSTVSGNTTVGYGGGIFASGDSLTLAFVTITGNVADTGNSGYRGGGGIFRSRGGVIVVSSIVAGNRRVALTPDDCLGAITSQGHTLWGDRATCPATGPGDQDLATPNLSIASVLDPTLADNGGPTRTHALVAAGLARDNGDNATCPVPIATDQRGVPRNDGRCDIGAVEYTPTPPSPSPSSSPSGNPSPSGSPSPSGNPAPSPSSGPCGTRFGDVPSSDPACAAIEALAGRGVIKGCDQEATPPLFCPDQLTLRAQMAALIVRAMGWGGETPANPFSDKCDPVNPANCVDDELWNAVGVLGAKNVAKGYTDGPTCAPSAAPCYAARDNVLYAQTISFITRAMVEKGYWAQATTDTGTVYANIPQASGHRLDFVTYTQNVGPVPGTSSATQDFAAWDQPSTRAWFAQALWQALQGH